ncbi:hypothetical protein SAMN04487846_2420 [Microbacterium sp. cf046]|uniref:hypothetical protein n=1 Tax=Microbacterium sp. cf046 TaxID=1761803 RepID=UPI0008F1B251|nr:hypothetical protein [Microbacterium sp. cf046]SFS08711.1 hypothetical protein SAMN04487846_2420 [Microbacterium sp. cf046]
MKRAATIGLAIGATAVVALGLGVAIWASTRPPSAVGIVQDYFAALEAGDADRAVASTAIQQQAADEAVAAYGGASDRVTDARVTSSSEQSDSARVDATYSLAGDPHEVSLRLTHDEANGWRITDAVAVVTASATVGGDVGIGDAVVPAGGDVALLPGRYEFAALPPGLVSGTTTVDAEPGVDQSVTVAASLTAEATAAAQTQLDAYADECTEPATAVPEHCGIRVPWAADLATLTAVEFRIDERPTVELDGDAKTFAATGGVLVATVTGTTRAGATASFTYRADDWALRGTVSFGGGEMVLAVG